MTMPVNIVRKDHYVNSYVLDCDVGVEEFVAEVRHLLEDMTHTYRFQLHLETQCDDKDSGYGDGQTNREFMPLCTDIAKVHQATLDIFRPPGQCSLTQMVERKVIEYLNDVQSRGA